MQSAGFEPTIPAIEPSQFDALDRETTGIGIVWNVRRQINPLNAVLNPICHLLALLGAHHILHVSRIRVKDKHPVASSLPNLNLLVDGGPIFGLL